MHRKPSTARHAVLIAAVALLAACGGDEQPAADNSQQAAPEFEWRLAETWPPNYPIFGDGTRALADKVERMSNGRLTIRVDSNNKHKAPLGIFDLVKGGQYEMGHSASYYWKGKDPNTLYFTTMPFGMTAPEQHAWFYYGGGMALMAQVYEPHGLLSFPGGNTGNQMGGWFQKEIRSLADLEGLKMRIPGFAGEIMARLGAKPTNIPGGELYTALERRTIDALEWVGPALDLRMGFQKIARYYYTGWHEPAAELQFLINKEKWDQLPPDLQEIMRTAIRAVAADIYAQTYHLNGENLARMRSENPEVEIRSFPKDVLDAMRRTNDELLAERAAQDPLAQQIVDSMQAYLAQTRAWTAISDQAYLNTVQ